MFGAHVPKRLALAAIRGYQRWLSPHKGFCCALRAATGDASCSAFGYRVIERFGLRRGLGLLERRLELCGHVHRSTSAPRPRPPVRNPCRHKEQGHCDVPCDSPGCDGPGCDWHGHGCGASGGMGDLLDAVGGCGDAVDCGRSGRRGTQRCRSCGGGRSARRRDPAHLDALARRIEERRRRLRS